MSSPTECLALRPIQDSDLEQLMPIEVRAYPYPWTPGIFNDCLRHQHYHCLLHEQQDVIRAYGVISVAVQEMHLLNLTVSPDYQSQGLGKRLLYTLEMLGRELDAQECFLEVRPSNKAAIQLYLNQGFNEIGLRKDYYPATQGREDAVVMAKSLL